MEFAGWIVRVVLALLLAGSLASTLRRYAASARRQPLVETFNRPSGQPSETAPPT